jgi:hypothetical protein
MNVDLCDVISILASLIDQVSAGYNEYRWNTAVPEEPNFPVLFPVLHQGPPRVYANDAGDAECPRHANRVGVPSS